MLRVALIAIGATLGWWIGILVGMTLGGAVGFFASPLVGRMFGGLLAGLIGGAIEARTNPAMRGKRWRFTGASALATALAAMLLLDVQILPWLVGGAFGLVLGAAQATALRLPRRDVLVRVLASTVAWSLGFLVLRYAGAFSRLGVLAPGAVALVALVVRPRTLDAQKA